MILNKLTIWLKKLIHSPKQEDKVVKPEEEITRWTRYTLDKTNWNINKIQKSKNND